MTPSPPYTGSDIYVGDSLVHFVFMNKGPFRCYVMQSVVGGGRVSDFLEKSVTKMYGSWSLLAL